MEENEANNPKSLHSVEKCYVRFINNTNRKIEVFWLDFTGEYVQFRVIQKGGLLDVNTYKTHPFLAKDIDTKDVMHIGGQYFYLPKTSKEIFKERYPTTPCPGNLEVRVRAFITIPVYSLHFACLLAIRNRLQKEEQVDQLCVPNNLAEQLKIVIAKRNKEMQLFDHRNDGIVL